MTIASGLMDIDIGHMQVSAATFKATSLKLLERASRTGETIIVTKRGKPFVKIRVDSDVSRLVSVAVLIGSTACNARTAESLDAGSRPDGEVMTDASASSDASCEPVGNDCAPAELCCAARGRRVDRARACLAREETLLACLGRSSATSRCVLSGAIGCYTRNVDGGTEVFYTNAYWSREHLPAFEECSDEVQQEMLAAEASGTCP